MLQVTAAVLLLLFIQCQAEDVKPMENFDENKYMGTWFGAIVASNCAMFKEMKKDMTRPTITYAKDGNILKNSVAFKTPKGCQQMDATLETIANGHYKHDSVHGKNEIIVVNTDYDTTALEMTILVHEGKTCMTAKMFRRDQKLPEDVKEQGLKHFHSKGFTNEDILIFTTPAECSPK
ncbi:olfactory protein-like [Eleutherodactylus coqui]|uniref:olfactory protein-like n=1 Tax=Eleutherodactylus coqui TaxID=57060 RepID=UPI0034629FBB